MPLTMAALVVGGLALVGVPGTVGFVSKWALVTAALEQDALFLAFLIMGSSVLAVVYIWRLAEVIYFQEPDGTPSTKTSDAPKGIEHSRWLWHNVRVYAYC
jgi:multicomponent Na+:H+ antiporter subunit D